jgi:hypothetical protein
MNLHDLNMTIAHELKAINDDAGAFVAGILSDDIGRDDQITFALRLVRLAARIKERADSTAGMVVEGGVVDDGHSGRLALTAGTDDRADHSRPTVDE